MKTIKKSISVLLALTLLLALSSCGVKEAENAVASMLDTVKSGEISEIANYVYVSELMDDAEGIGAAMLSKVLGTVEYKILSSKKLDDLSSTVETYISMADLESFLPAILDVAAHHAEDTPEITDEELSKYLLDLFDEAIESGSFERVSSTFNIDVMTLEDGRLLPQASAELIDVLFGKFLIAE